jgi:hypothetical protein
MEWYAEQVRLAYLLDLVRSKVTGSDRKDVVELFECSLLGLPEGYKEQGVLKDGQLGQLRLKKCKMTGTNGRRKKIKTKAIMLRPACRANRNKLVRTMLRGGMRAKRGQIRSK